MMVEYKELLDRIIKGAEFIASIDENHPLWEEAQERYEQLCQKVLRIRFGKEVNR